MPNDTNTTTSETDNPSELAIHSRSRRTIRPAVDFLVEHAERFDVERLYSRKRVRSPEARPVEMKSSVEIDPVIPPVAATSTRCSTPPPPPPPQPSTPPRTPPHRMSPVARTPPPRTPPPQSRTQLTPQSTPSRRVAPQRPAPTIAPVSDDTILELFLLTLSSRQATIRIMAGRSTMELASRVETLLGIPQDQVCFKWNGEDLPKAHTPGLGALGIRSGDSILIRMQQASTSGPQASPFKGRVSLLSAPSASLPPSPFKQLPDWLRKP